MAYDFNGSNQWISGAAPVTAVPLTLACWFNPDAVNVDYTLFGVSDDNTTTNGFFLRALGSIGGDPVAASTAAGGFFTASSAAGFTAGSWQHACAVFASSTSRVAYRNGVAGSANTTSAVPTGIDNLSIGRLTRASPTNYADSKIAECAVWNVDLTAAEVASLASGVEAWCVRPDALVFYAPLVRPIADHVGQIALTNNNTATVFDHPPIIRRRRAQIFVPKLVSGGGATDLIIQDATHGHTADGVSLTQQHQLAVQDASHAHAADNITLTQQNQLAVADATHGHAADNLTLSTEITLSIADALHGHSVDNITLVQQHVLVVADATHGHSADNVTLDTGVALAVADASHGHTVDNLILTQQHVLVVADSLHQHTADNVVMQVQSTEPEESYSGHYQQLGYDERKTLNTIVQCYAGLSRFYHHAIR